MHARCLSPALVATLLIASGADAADKPLPFHVAATEVTVKSKDARKAAWAEALRTAATREADYYGAARPVVMRIAVEKVGFKSAGKAVASMLPVVAMFAGANRNVMKGKVELVDAATRKTLKRFKIECDDDTQFSVGDGLAAYAKLGVSFLPFGSLIASAVEVGESAAAKRSNAEAMLTRGFVMLSYKKAYGSGPYRRHAERRKADLAALAAPTRVTPPPVVPTLPMAAAQAAPVTG